MIVPTDDFPARLSACARSPASAGARRPASVSVSTAVMNLLLSVLRYAKPCSSAGFEMSCASPCHIGRAGFWVYESARRWRDNNSYNLQSCDHGLTHREPPFRVSVCVAVRGARLPRRRVGLEPTPWPATERTRCPYSEIFESGQRDIMRHFCFQCIDITSHIAQWHHGCAQLGRRTPSPYTTLVPCPMNPTAHL